MVENEETPTLCTSPSKSKEKVLSEILPVRAPFLDRTNNDLGEKDSNMQVPLAGVEISSPTKIITSRDGLLTPERWAINRSPDVLSSESQSRIEKNI